MGYYVNPRDRSKEQWLAENGEPTNGPCEITEEHLPVVLVDNGPFTAAGVGFDAREIEAFTLPHDRRPKQWFKVPRSALIAVGAI